MTYTVKGGDTLSGILKKLGAKSWSSPSTWNLVKTASGSPHMIRPGERLDLSRVPGIAQTSTAPKTTTPKTTQTPGEKLIEGVADKKAPMRKFEDSYGELRDMMPLPYMQQFAAQQANPFALREAVRTMRDWERGLGGGYHGSGYQQAQRQRGLHDVQTYQKELEQQFLDPQKQLFTDWYGTEKERYELDPTYEARRFADPNLMGGREFDPNQSFANLAYNPYDVTQHFGGGISGYGATPDYGRLYGSVT